MDTNLLKIREYRPDIDEHFIVKSFFEGLKFGHPYYKMIDDDAYFHWANNMIYGLLRDNSIQKDVCCLIEDEEVIVGYSIYAFDILYWIYVKTRWRMMGIAKNLILDKNIKTVSTITKIGNALRLKYNFKFNPFI